MSMPQLRRSSPSKEEELEKFLDDSKRRSQAIFDRSEQLAAEKEAEKLKIVRAAEAEIAEQIDREQKSEIRRREVAKEKGKIPFSLSLAIDICERISEGEVLKSICDDHTMPAFACVMDWLEDKTSSEKVQFQKMYMKACSRRLKVFEDELITIADNSQNDYIDKINVRTQEELRVLDPEAIARSKMRIEMRLKILQAYEPGKWGNSNSASAASSAAAAIKDRMPTVVFNFHEAPKALRDGDDAKVIEHAPPMQQMTLEELKQKIASR